MKKNSPKRAGTGVLALKRAKSIDFGPKKPGNFGKKSVVDEGSSPPIQNNSAT